MNQLTIIGNLARDPEFRVTKSGKDVASFTVAVNEGFGEKQTTTFFRVTAWGEYTKVCKYLSKGKKCAVIGRVSLHLYDNSGKPGGSLEVTAEKIELLTPKQADPTIDDFQQIDGDLPF